LDKVFVFGLIESEEVELGFAAEGLLAAVTAGETLVSDGLDGGGGPAELPVNDCGAGLGDTYVPGT
jgi:hypothetical protein